MSFRRLSCLCEGINRTPIVAVAIALLASGTFTQTLTGTLIGLVHDPQNKTITGADVQLSRVDAWQPVSHIVTDTNGRFKFVGLSPGVYSLQLNLPGWQVQHLSHLIIEATRNLDIDIVLSPTPPSPGNKQFQSPQLIDRDVLVGRRLGQVSMHKLPTTRRIWSLIENQETSTVTDPLDTGGLQTGRLSLFGARGVSWTENGYSMNGFDVTDPYLPGRPITDPDFDALADVTVVRSAKPASFSGSGVNLLLTTLQAPPGLHGTARAFYSNHALQSDNMDAGLVQLGFSGPERLRYLVDASGQLSGKLPLSDAPFFISLSTQQLSKTLGGFAAPIDAHVYHLLTRFTAFSRGSKQLNLLYAGQHLFNSREGADPRIAPSATCRGNDNYQQFQVRWTSLPSASSTLELGLGVAHASLSSGLQPGTSTISTIDLPQLTETGAAPFSFAGTRTRYQSNAQLLVVHNGTFGSHSVVLGAAFDRSNITNRWSALGGIEQILVDGVGAEVVQWNTPTQARQHVTQFAVFVQDAWRPVEWLAVPFGVRLENSSGQSASASNRINWTTIEPRVGFVIRLPVTGFVLRGGFARYGHVLQGNYLDFGNAFALGGQVLEWQDASGDRQAQSQEIDRLLRVFGGPYSAVAQNVRRPLSDEITVELTKQFGDRFVTRVRFFRRDDRRLVGIVNSGVPFSSYVPTLVIDPGNDGMPGTADDQSLTLFDRKPAALGEDFFVLTNPTGYRGSAKGFEIEMLRPFARHWQAAVNFAAMHTSFPTNPGNGVFQNDPGFIITDQSVFAASNADPNTLLFATGRTYFDRGFTGNLSAYYEAPYGMRLGVVARYYDGLVFGRMLFVNGFEQGPFFVRATPRGDFGAFRTEFNSTLDLNVARTFDTKGSKVSLTIDVFNLLNLNNNTLESDLTSPNFAKRIPLAIQSPRTFRLGVSWEF
ncbi:MAG TPA: carboxypeptidase regulatory-like domain-containing protein [Pyrinomonadaceae bacterium]|nr:carboxypeptidase regulatory-like domain-containing protein [Pyrinomonadaceae bacterium]